MSSQDNSSQDNNTGQNTTNEFQEGDYYYLEFYRGTYPKRIVKVIKSNYPKDKKVKFKTIRPRDFHKRWKENLWNVTSKSIKTLKKIDKDDIDVVYTAKQW